MQLRVGPFQYTVQLVHGYIEHEGEACLGLCDTQRQRILLSDVPPPNQRLQVFFHELMHAWWHHFQVRVGDEEAVADVVGAAMTEFVLQALDVVRHQQASGGRESGIAEALAGAATAATRAGAAYEVAAMEVGPAVAAPSPSFSQGTAKPRLAPSAVRQSAGWRIHVYEPSPGAAG